MGKELQVTLRKTQGNEHGSFLIFSAGVHFSVISQVLSVSGVLCFVSVFLFLGLCGFRQVWAFSKCRLCVTAQQTLGPDQDSEQEGSASTHLMNCKSQEGGLWLPPLSLASRDHMAMSASSNLGCPLAESREEQTFANQDFRESKLGCRRLAEAPKDARFLPEVLWAFSPAPSPHSESTRVTEEQLRRSLF